MNEEERCFGFYLSEITRSKSLSRERPDVEEVAAELEVAAKTVRDTLLAARAAYSLDKALGPDGDTTLLSILADPGQESPETKFLRDETRTYLVAALGTLNARERHILRLYYGLDGHRRLTLDQIGSLYRLTRPRVGQLKERALGKLRHPALLDLAGEMEVI